MVPWQRRAAGSSTASIPRPPGVLTILTYHRVDEPAARPDLMPSLISATPASFAAQIAMVARHFDPVSLPDVLASLDDPARLPRRAVLVTFDDGYRDFATNAWPVLRAASVPATMFVATGAATDPSTPYLVGSTVGRGPASARPGPDRHARAVALPVGAEHARRTVGTIRDWLKTLDHDEAMREVDRIVEELGARDGAPPDEDPVLTVGSAPAVLGWDELRTLARDGVTLAPHTRHHPLLDRVPLETAIEEIAGSHADLEREIGPLAPIPRVLAYPSGAHGGSAVTAAREAGMDIAMTTDRGGNDLRRVDRLRLRRINVGGRAGVPLIRAQLAWAAGLDARRSPD